MLDTPIRTAFALASLALSLSVVGCGGGSPSTTPTVDTSAAIVMTTDDQAAKDIAAIAENTHGRTVSAAEETSTQTPQAAKPTSFDRAAVASFAALEQELGGTSGIAVAAVGPRAEPSTVGTLRHGSAWSTMKVPVAMATVAAGAGASDDMARAITASDNEAAERLWSSLGPPAQAGPVVERQLAAAGDTRTRVQTERIRPEFTAFGQTDWTLGQQARFVAGMKCVPSAAPVLELMGRVESDQRWGLGTVDSSARFKGGWGPGPDGHYLVRQMGIVTIHDVPVSIAIATKPTDGSFESGTRNLTRIAQWVRSHLNVDGLSARSC